MADAVIINGGNQAPVILSGTQAQGPRGDKGDKGDPGSGGNGVNLADYLASDRIPFVTDDLPAFIACRNAITAQLQDGLAGSGIMLVPKGRYYISDRFDTNGVHIVGEGSGQPSGAGTVIRGGLNKSVIRLTQGVNGVGASLTGVTVWGGNVTVDSTGHVTAYGGGISTIGNGVEVASNWGKLNDVSSVFNGQAGIVADSNIGQCNCFTFINCQSHYNGGPGYLFVGSDANAGTTIGCSAYENTGAGFLEFSFLGNTHIQPHTRDNGYNGPSVFPVGTCTYGGNKYYVAAEYLTLASTQIPGTGNAWILHNGIIAERPWVSGLTWQPAGGYITLLGNPNARNVFVGAYAESGQAPVQAEDQTLFLGGLLDEVGFRPGSAAGWVRGTRSGIQTGGILSRGPNTTRGVTLGSLPGVTGANSVWSYDDGTTAYEMLETGGLLQLKRGGAPLAEYTQFGLNVVSGKAYQVAGQQVVGARGAAVADATDAASVITQLNLLLARLRTHGLIA